MDSKLFGIDNRAALGQLFKVAFGVTPVYMTVPIGSPGEVKIEGFNPSVKEDEINEDEKRIRLSRNDKLLEQISGIEYN